MFFFSALYQLLRGLLVPRLVLVTENLALRQQLLVLRRSTKRPRLRYRDGGSDAAAILMCMKESGITVRRW